MANATSNLKQTEVLGPDLDPSRSLPMSGSVHIFAGTLVSTNPTDVGGHPGFVQPLLPNSGSVVLGVAMAEADNTNGTSGAMNVQVRTGIFKLANGTDTDAITADDLDAVLYGIDDNTVGITSGSEAPFRPPVGTLFKWESTDFVWVKVTG